MTAITLRELLLILMGAFGISSTTQKFERWASVRETYPTGDPSLQFK
jgi:hypothetical protein